MSLEFGPCAEVSGNRSVAAEVGQGAYATVRFGMQKENGTKVAIKIYEKSRSCIPSGMAERQAGAVGSSVQVSIEGAKSRYCSER